MDRPSIAIIGFGCRYPGASSPQELWQNLVDGVEAIGSPPPWRAGHFVPGQKGGFVDDVDAFDANFFKITPHDAAHMDPQQRLLLQLTWSALEDAGLDPIALRGSDTAVVVGVAGSEYAELVVAAEEHLSVANYLAFHPSIHANRISQSFGFTGFSSSVNTACSSALVAVDLACRELWLKRSQLAIAAGASLIFDPSVTQRFINSGWLSARWQCRSLDASADGYVRSEGVGVVVLKLLDEAVADGDRIYALIQDTRSRHNGQGNGLALPCMQSQIDLLRDVYSSPGVDPIDLHYVELNALGARVGDVIELKALATAVCKQRRGAKPLRVGSLKPNIGHSEAASGMAALIKTALALHHKQLPPTLHYQSCDPSLDLEKLGLVVPTTLESFPPSAKPLLAGISAFGFGGANVHVLLGESPRQAPPPGSAAPVQVLLLSAQTSCALRKRCATLLEFLRCHPGLALADICWTVNRSRSQLPLRLAILAASNDQLQDRLAQAINAPDTSQPGVLPHQVPSRAIPPPVGFVFTGRCAFSLDDLAALAVVHPTVAQFLDLAQRLLKDRWQDNPPPALGPLLGELVLHQLWLDWGIEPSEYLAEPGGRASASVAKAVAAGGSDQKAALHELISAPDRAASLDQEWPEPTNAMGEEWALIYIGSGLVASRAAVAGLAAPPQGVARPILLEAAVRLAQRGVPVAWRKVCGSPHGQVLSLPTYPFARERHWLGEPARPVARAAGLDGDSEHHLALATPLEDQLHSLWAEVLGHGDFGFSDNFFLVGGHSKAAAALAARLETTLGKAMPLDFAFRSPTLSEQTAWLLQPTHQDPNHLVTLQPLGSRPPLYILHGLGGKVGQHIDLARAFSPHRPVIAVRGGSDDPLRNGGNMSNVAEIYAKEILSTHPGGPIHLMGWSAGGWYAYAVAAELLKLNVPMGLLALLDTYPNTRIHRRLGVALFGRILRSEILHHQLGLLNPPPGKSHWDYALERMHLLNYSAAVYLRMQVPGPKTLKALKERLQGKAEPPDPYLHLLTQASKPPRLPLQVDLFAPPGNLPILKRFWHFYARRGVRSWPLFKSHTDFVRADLAQQLATALEAAIRQNEPSLPPDCAAPEDF